MFVRMVTLVLGLLITRVLSEHFSLLEYGTYSQILLVTTTTSSITMLGMMDGVNFFFCKEKDEEKRNAYVSTIFFLHYLVGILVSIVLLVCTVPISRYFENEDLQSLMIFAATLPVLQNSISLLQIMFLAIGKARTIAVRNLLVSVAKLIAMVLACYVFDNIAVILLCQLLTDAFQVVYFFGVLRKKEYRINIFKFDKRLIKEILAYCVPMAMFTVIKSLNRDADKFVISFFTDTETLAVYANASKILPFDIVMSSFCTVLLPYITRYIAERKYDVTQQLYKAFLELSCIATTILAIGAVCVAPELMEFLYSEKYVSVGFGIPVFVIYILVDVISVLTITLLLSAAGKTKTILFASIGTFCANIVLNIGLFLTLGEIGPAIATLSVTLIQGIVILSLGAREIRTNILEMFNRKFLGAFVLETLGMAMIVCGLRSALLLARLPNMITMGLCYAAYVIPLFCINFPRLLKCLQMINDCKNMVGGQESQ